MESSFSNTFIMANTRSGRNISSLHGHTVGRSHAGSRISFRRASELALSFPGRVQGVVHLLPSIYSGIFLRHKASSGRISFISHDILCPQQVHFKFGKSLFHCNFSFRCQSGTYRSFSYSQNLASAKFPVHIAAARVVRYVISFMLFPIENRLIKDAAMFISEEYDS